MRPKSKEKEMSPCERPIMKLVWTYDGDIPVQELIEQLRVQYGKDYARTTVVTFLKKLSEKGFIQTYRKGNASYVHPLIPLEKYRAETLQKAADFWYDGEASAVMAALFQPKTIRNEEIQKMRELLDGMDL